MMKSLIESKYVVSILLTLLIVFGTCSIGYPDVIIDPVGPGDVLYPVGWRTQQVQDAILLAVPSVDNAADVTRAHLAAITRLNLASEGITSLKSGDFDGLTGLKVLQMQGNSISDISALKGLTSLTRLYLNSNSISDISALEDLTALTTLFLNNNDIIDISPLEDLTSLTELNLSNNSISDISALEDLTALTSLILYDNSINDISALQNLTSLTTLNLSNNSISDISALQNLTSLKSLSLKDNSISDISALQNLTSLSGLRIAGNPLSSVAYSTLRFIDNKRSGAYIDIFDRENIDFYNYNFPPRFYHGNNTIRTVAENTTSGTNIGTAISAVDRDADDTLTYTLGGTDAASFSIVSTSGQLLTKAALDYEKKSSYSVTVTVYDGNSGGDRITITINVTNVIELLDGRTPQVCNAIVAAAGVNSNADITEAHLAAITALDLSGQDISALKSGDFDGLTSLSTLSLGANRLTALPSDIFDGLTALTNLDLANLNNLVFGEFTSLPSDIFDGLTALTDLDLRGNDFSTLPVGLFNGLTSLTDLKIGGDFSTLPVGIFDGLTNLENLALHNKLTTLPGKLFDELTSLTFLDMQNNEISSIQADTFDGLTSLKTLFLQRNRLTSLPDGIFEGLTSLFSVGLEGNPGDPFRIGVSLVKVGTDQFKAVVPTGAFFNFVLPITVVNGGIKSLKTSITIPAGSVESQPLTVTRSPGTTAPVTVNFGTLPRDPLLGGYTFVNSTGQGLSFTEVDVSAVTPVSERTPQVRDAIVAAVPGVSNAADVTEAHLAKIRRLILSDKNITALKSGDFDGLTSLRNLYLGRNRLTSLPDDIFSGLSAVRQISLYSNNLTTLTAGVFDDLLSLTELNLNGNNIASLPAGIFDDLSLLTELSISNNAITSLPPSIFDNLLELEKIYLGGNALTGLPVGIFDNLSSLTVLSLGGTVYSNTVHYNQISSLPSNVFSNLSSLTNLVLTNNSLSDLPAGMFSGLSALTSLWLQGNPGAPFSLTVSLEKDGTDQFKAVIATGAPFDIVLPLTVTNGNISGGATTITISKGNVESGTLTVTRTAGTTAAVTVDIGTLPSLPQNHNGYTLQKTIYLPLSLSDTNNNPVFTDGTTTTRSIAENTTSGQHIGTAIAATDADTGDTLTYTLGGTDAATFSIVSTSGQLQTKAALDYETKTSYTVIISVSDGQGGSDSITVTINVTDVDETPLVPVGRRTVAVRDAIVAAVPSVRNAANVTKAHIAAITSLNLRNAGITTLQANDFSGLTSLTSLNLYNNQLSSLPDGIFVGLTSLTTIRLSRNAVNPLPFIVSLEKVADGQFKAVAPAGALFNIVLPVTVTNGSITGGATSVTIPQGSVESSILTVTRTAGTTAHVSVDIGILPSLPRNHYGYTLVKSDMLPLTVIRGTNTAPVFTDGTSTTRTIAENTAANTNIGTPIAATDADNDTLTYSLGQLGGVVGLSGANASAFSIVSTTGQLQTKAALDYETKASYTFTVSVSDGNGGTDSITVTINVTDVNEGAANTAPVFTDGTRTTRTIAENTAANTNIGTPISATDADNDTLTYSLGGGSGTGGVSGLSGNDADSFRIVSTTGQLQTKAALDYETKSRYTVTVTVSDGSLTDTIMVTINITDVNEVASPPPPPNSAPVFTEGTTTTRSIAENTVANTNIGTAISATDADNDTLTYSFGNLGGPIGLSGNDAAAFRIVTTTGQLQTRAALDYETKSSYTFTVSVSDGNGGSDSISVTINVTDVNEAVSTTRFVPLADRTAEVRAAIVNAVPNVNNAADVTKAHVAAITSLNLRNAGITALSAGDFSGMTALTTLNLHSNQLSSLPSRLFEGLTSLTTVRLGGNSVDPLPLTVTLQSVGAGEFKAVAPAGALFDIVVNITVSHGSVIGGARTVTIPHGSLVSNTLTVMRTAGTTAHVTVDIEALPSLPRNHYGYTLAKSGNLPLIIIRGTNTAPVFTAGTTTTRSVAENTVSNTNIGAPISATDADNDPLTYSLGGTNATSFRLDTSTGQLQTRTALDYETKTSYSVTISVSDGYGGSDSIAVRINVTDVQENRAPVFTEGVSTTRTVAENTTSGQNIGTAISATDADNDTLTYTLSGTNAGAFSIVRTTGQLQTKAALDYETKTSYSVTVNVSDGNGGSDSISVRINVTDVQENRAPVFTDGSTTTRSVAENTGASINIGRAISATDADNDTLTYSLGGTDAASFSIVSTSGQLQTKAALDYETKTTYTVTVTVSDGTLTDTITVTINVTDVDERQQQQQTTAVCKVGDVLDPGESCTYPDTDAVFSVQSNGKSKWHIPNLPPLLQWINKVSIGGSLRVSTTINGVKYHIVAEQTGTSWEIKEIGDQGVEQPGTPPQQPPNTGATPTLKFSTGAPLTEATLHGGVITLNLTDGVFESSNFRLRDALTFSGISGVTYGRFGVERVSDTKVTVELVFDGNMTTDGTLSISVGSGAIKDYSGAAFTSQISVTAVTESISVSTASTLTEANLDEAEVTLTLSGRKFESSVFDIRDEVSVSGITGVTFPWHDPDRDSDTQLTLELEFSGDMTTNGTLTFTIGKGAIAGYNGPDLTAQINVTATGQTAVNNAPVFSAGTSTSRSVVENTASGTNIGSAISATDADSGDTLTYTLGGTDAASFRIVSTTGQLQTSAALDYEMKSSYSVTVSVSDGNGGSDSITVTINVTDVNENVANSAPVFTDGSSTSRSVVENTASGTNIGSAISATDADSGDTLTYTLGGTDAASFRIVSTTGQLQTSAALDYETKSSYTVSVSVSDGNGGSDSITVTINVTDVNESSTSSLTASTSSTLTEANLHEAVVTLTLTGKVFEEHELSVARRLSVSGINGVTFDTWDVELVSDTEVSIELTYDGNITTAGTLTFTVGAAAIQNYTGSALTATVSVSAVTESIAVSPTSLTEATLDEAEVTLTLSGRQFVSSTLDVRDAVSVSGISGVTYPWHDPDKDGDTELTFELEFDGDMTTDGTLTFTVGADAIAAYNGPALTAQVSVSASTAASVDTGDQTSETPETPQQPVSGTTPTLTVTTSPSQVTEASLNDTVVSLNLSGGTFESASWDLDDEISVSGITGVSYDDFFDVDRISNTEVEIDLSFRGNMTADGTLTFTVSSGAIVDYNGANLTVTVSVSAVKESITVSPKSLTEATLNGTKVTFTLSGRKFEGLVFDIQDAMSVSGITDVTYPWHDPDRDSDTQITLVLQFSGDMTTNGTLTFTVGAGAIANYTGPALTAKINVTASGATTTPTPTNNAPVFSAGTSTSRSVAENTASGTNIGSAISATDSDSGDTLTYTLGGTDAASFRIVSTTGQLQTSAALDYETKNSYTVSVSVSDGNGDSDSITVTINVTDVNENVANSAPVFTDGTSTTRSVAENTASGTNIGSAISATDADNHTLTYSLGGTDAASFSIVSTSGQLQTKAALDYETKSSYSVTVSVSDGNGGSDSITVTINVTDVNESSASKLSVSTSTLTESTLDGTEITLTLSGYEFESFIFDIRDATSVSGITGVTIPWHDPDRESDTQISLELEFEGNMTTNGTLTFTIGAGAIQNYTGSALTATISVSAVTESIAVSPTSLTEATLDEAEVTLTLSGRKFERSVFDIRDAVSVSGITGVTYPWHDPDKESNTELSFELEFSGDMTTNGTLTFTVGAGAIANYNGPDLTAQISVTAGGGVGLGANFPNPFNPETWIPYQLAKPADVALTIYNMRGVVVRQFKLGHKAAGVYTSRSRAIYWDGRNMFGEKVATGVYFYTLTAGDFTATRKMLIRK